MLEQHNRDVKGFVHCLHRSSSAVRHNSSDVRSRFAVAGRRMAAAVVLACMTDSDAHDRRHHGSGTHGGGSGTHGGGVRQREGACGRPAVADDDDSGWREMGGVREKKLGFDESNG